MSNNNNIHDGAYNAMFRQLLFIAVLITIGVVVFSQLRFFIGSLLGAITLYVVFRGLLFHMTEKWGWNNWASSIALVGINTVILAVGGYHLFKLIAAEIPDIDTAEMVNKFNNAVTSIDNFIGFKVIPEDLVSSAGGFIAKGATAILNTTYSFAVNIFMMLVILLFMFASGRRMECYLYRYMPFRGRSLCLLRAEFKNIIFSNAVGIPLIIAGQAVVAMLIYWLLGLESPVFLGLLTGLCGLIPIVGTAIVYVPVAIYMLAGGAVFSGIIMLLYGFLVIANVDNLIRIVIMGKYADTHPLVVIFGVILGLPLFGFWGIIFGPLLISGFLLLIRIYYVEYGLLASKDEAMEMAYSERKPHPEETKPDKNIGKLRAVKAARAMKLMKCGPEEEEETDKK